MFFLSKVWMCYSAETLKKLISLWFLQCFVKVAFFRTRQSKHQIFLQNLSNLYLFFNRKLTEKSIKNQHFRALRIWSHFGPVLDPILTPFWHHFWSFWGVLGPLGSHFGCPGPSQAASRGSAWLSWGAWDPPGPPGTSIWDNFDLPGPQFWPNLAKFLIKVKPLWCFNTIVLE